MFLGRQRFKTLTAQDVETMLIVKALTVEGSKMQIPAALGIDNASKLFDLFGVVIGLLYDVLKGNKVRAFSQITKAISAFIKNRQVFKNSGIVWDEMRDLEETERQDLSALLLSSLDLNLDLEDPKTAEIVNNAVRGIIDLTALAVRANS